MLSRAAQAGVAGIRDYPADRESRTILHLLALITDNQFVPIGLSAVAIIAHQLIPDVHF